MAVLDTTNNRGDIVVGNIATKSLRLTLVEQHISCSPRENLWCIVDVFFENNNELCIPVTPSPS